MQHLQQPPRQCRPLPYQPPQIPKLTPSFRSLVLLASLACSSSIGSSNGVGYGRATVAHQDRRSEEVPLHWKERRQRLVSKNPWYGRTILPADIPHAHQMIRRTRRLPLGHDWRIAYLIQGEEDCDETQEAMWSAQSDVFLLTFRDFRPQEAIFYPNSWLAEGRNVLLAAAAAEELQRGWRYWYYVFLDADAEAVPPWPSALTTFREFLVEWEPAVGLPEFLIGLNFSGDPLLPRSVFIFDHIFIAVHSEALPALLPYNATFDGECRWVSQWIMSLLASAIFVNHVLVLPAVRIGNPVHSDYPKEECDLGLAAAINGLRASTNAKVKECFPALQGNQVVKMGEGLWSERDLYKHWLNHMFYQPWGIAAKGQNVDYSALSLHTLGPCDKHHDSPLFPSRLLKGALQSKSLVDFCRGCSPEEVLLLAQGMVAVQPFESRRWNLLGLLLDAGGNPLLGISCLLVSRRLLELQGLPTGGADANIAEMSSFHLSQGYGNTAFLVKSEGLFQSSHILEQIMADTFGQPLLASDRIAELMESLGSGS